MALSRESRDGYEQWWARAECRTDEPHNGGPGHVGQRESEANNVWLPSQCAHQPALTAIYLLDDIAEACKQHPQCLAPIVVVIDE